MEAIVSQWGQAGHRIQAHPLPDVSHSNRGIADATAIHSKAQYSFLDRILSSNQEPNRRSVRSQAPHQNSDQLTTPPSTSLSPAQQRADDSPRSPAPPLSFGPTSLVPHDFRVRPLPPMLTPTSTQHYPVPSKQRRNHPFRGSWLLSSLVILEPAQCSAHLGLFCRVAQWGRILPGDLSLHPTALWVRISPRA